MTLDSAVSEAGLAGQLGELVAAEGGGDGDGTVVERQGVPTEQGPRGGQKAVGKPMAFQVLNNQGAAGGGGEAAEELDDLGVGEVVEEEAGVDEVDRADGQAEGVADDFGRGGAGEVAVLEVEADDGGAGEVALDDAAHVAGGGADVEERESIAGQGE